VRGLGHVGFKHEVGVSRLKLVNRELSLYLVEQFQRLI
jgi:hypothetical protein